VSIAALNTRCPAYRGAMAAVVLIFVGFFVWGVAMVWIDARAKRRLRPRPGERQFVDPAELRRLADEAERWLQDR
jgi:uncharacterized membrane protein